MDEMSCMCCGTTGCLSCQWKQSTASSSGSLLLFIIIILIIGISRINGFVRELTYAREHIGGFICGIVLIYFLKRRVIQHKKLIKTSLPSSK